MLGRNSSFPVRLHIRGLPPAKRCSLWVLLIGGLAVFVVHLLLTYHVENPAVTCGLVNEGEILTLGCPRYTLISAITFASFGDPSGECPGHDSPGFSHGTCHLGSSEAEVAAVCIGKQSCLVLARGGFLGGEAGAPTGFSSDPCPNLPAARQRLAVSIECAVGPDYNTDTEFNEISSRSWGLASEQAAMKRKQWQSRIGSLRGFPGRFQGRGIVIVVEPGGGNFALTLMAVKMLRRHGCTLPIQVWHRGVIDLSDEHRKSLSPYHVAARDFEDFVGAFDTGTEGTPTALLGNLRSQALALMHTDLEEVLVLRPGAFPLSDPSSVFDSAPYKATGAVFWPGLYKVAVENPVWRAVGAEPESAGWELDGGWLLVRKTAKTWPAIYLSVIFTEQYYASLLDGEKDAFRMAWLALKLPYHAVGHRPALVGTFKDQYGTKNTKAFCGHATLHYGLSGKPLWLRTNLKNKRLLERGANFRYLKAPRLDGDATIPTRAAHVGRIQGPNGTVDCLDLECNAANQGMCDKVAMSPELEHFEHDFLDTLASVPENMRNEIKEAPWSRWFWVYMLLLLAVVCGLWGVATSAFSDNEARDHSLVRGAAVLLGIASLKLRHVLRRCAALVLGNPIVSCVTVILLTIWIFWSSMGGDDREKMYSQLTGYQRPVPRMQREQPRRYMTDCAPCVSGQRCMPRQVHITYGSRILPHHKLLEAAWSPQYTFHYYNDTEAKEYMRTRCPQYADAYDCMVPGAYKSDIFRYCVLYNEGGMYLDNDLVVLVMPNEMFNESCPGVYLLPEYSLNSGLDVRIWTGMIMSSSQEPLWQCMLDEININVANRFYGSNPVDVTGPGLLSMCFHRYPDRVKEFGYNRRDSTIWLFAENNHGVPEQIGYEVNFGDKARISRDGREHYSKLWNERRIYSHTCKRGEPGI